MEDTYILYYGLDPPVSEGVVCTACVEHLSLLEHCTMRVSTSAVYIIILQIAIVYAGEQSDNKTL